MFAVPGWSIGTDAPKRDSAPKKSSKKKEERKRARDEKAASEPVTASTPAEQPSKPEKKSKKRKSFDSEDRSAAASEGHRNDFKSSKHSDGPPAAKRTKSSDSTGAPRHSKENGASSKHQEKQSKPTQAQAVPGRASSTKLTPMQSAMQKKLMGARFRHLNESLYTTRSSEATRLFGSNPTFFEEYHSGFRGQVASWPENPVDTFVSDLKRRAALDNRQKSRQPEDDETEAQTDAGVPFRPLPRTKGKCIVADLGCGDASLARDVAKFGKKSGIDVQSFDLQSTNEHVTKADIANLPLTNDSVNVAVFCLALMGTNWIDFIEEAWRILHWKGELWVAEIKSRFARPDRKTPAVDPKKDKKNKGGKKANQEDNPFPDEGVLSDEERDKTDVSAFIAVLKKRGFVMENERGADGSNKMFVRMKFIKATKPLKGKHKAALPADSTFAQRDRAWRSLLREDDEIDEASTLKPCLYKVR